MAITLRKRAPYTCRAIKLPSEKVCANYLKDEDSNICADCAKDIRENPPMPTPSMKSLPSVKAPALPDFYSQTFRLIWPQ